MKIYLIPEGIGVIEIKMRSQYCIDNNLCLMIPQVRKDIKKRIEKILEQLLKRYYLSKYSCNLKLAVLPVILCPAFMY